MSITGLLLRFALAYAALVLAAGVVFSVTGWRSNPGVQAGLMLGAIMWACLTFAQRNQRYLTAGEKKRVVLGMITIDVVLQLIWLVAIHPSATDEHLGLFAGVFVLIALLHTLVIYYFVGWVGRLHAKQQERLEAQRPRA